VSQLLNLDCKVKGGLHASSRLQVGERGRIGSPVALGRRSGSTAQIPLWMLQAEGRGSQAIHAHVRNVHCMSVAVVWERLHVARGMRHRTQIV